MMSRMKELEEENRRLKKMYLEEKPLPLEKILLLTTLVLGEDYNRTYYHSPNNVVSKMFW